MTNSWDKERQCIIKSDEEGNPSGHEEAQSKRMDVESRVIARFTTANVI